MHILIWLVLTPKWKLKILIIYNKMSATKLNIHSYFRAKVDMKPCLKWCRYFVNKIETNNYPTMHKQKKSIKISF